MMRRMGWVLLTVVCIAGCQKGVPYNSNSPAAKLRDGGQKLPVVGADDYARKNLRFSDVKIDYWEKDGEKFLRAYTKAGRASDLHKDNAESDYQLTLSLSYVKDGQVLREIEESGNFDGEDVELKDLCTETLGVVPDRVEVRMVRVVRRTSHEEVVAEAPPSTQPVDAP